VFGDCASVWEECLLLVLISGFGEYAEYRRVRFWLRIDLYFA
jgi:hypothetical protein